VLEREGIGVHMLAGTSMGGAVAALYAAGGSADEIGDLVSHFSRWRNFVRLLDWSEPRMGLFSAARITEMLEERLGGLDFSELTIPLRLVAVDLGCGEEVVLRSGSVLDAVCATSAFPVVFEPVRIGDRLLVDGGLLNNLPCDVVHEMGADVVIAVDVGAGLDDLPCEEDRSGSRWHIPRLGLGRLSEAMERSVDIMRLHLQRQKLAEFPPSALIRPVMPEGVSTFRGFERAAEIVEAGALAAEEALPAIRESMDRRLWIDWSLGK
jgi:NTE family protein